MDEPSSEPQASTSSDDPKKQATELFEKTFRAKGDFTIVYPNEFLNDIRRNLQPNWFERYLNERRGLGTAHRKARERSLYSEEFGVKVSVAGVDQEARVHACRSFGGRAWSLTVRWSSKLTQDQKESLKETPATGTFETELMAFKPEGLLELGPDGVPLTGRDGRPTEREHLSSFESLVKIIAAQFRDSAPRKGLILVAGETGSGKSNIVRGLIHAYLHDLLASETKPPRKPHLITFEDPVEKWLRRVESLQAAMASRSGEHGFRPAFHLDYTPRVVGEGLDCETVEDGLMRDALRQTPAAAYVGEIRKVQDFRACLDFAGTGHLVFATAHAGSVVEAMSKVLASVQAKTPGTRAVVASRILGVVHLKRLSGPKPAVPFEGDERMLQPPLVPAMWRRTQTGVQQLVADGLASVLPTGPARTTHDAFCLGRLFFVNEILKDANSPASDSAMRLSDSFKTHLRHCAREDDLNG